MNVAGVFERRKVPESMDSKYLRMDTSEAWGRHVGATGDLAYIKSRHDYDEGHSSTQVMKIRPTGMIDGEGHCPSTTITIGCGPVSASSTFGKCNSKLDPYERRTYFHHAWYGHESDDSKEMATGGHDVIEGAAGTANRFQYRLGAMEDDALLNESVVDKPYSG